MSGVDGRNDDRTEKNKKLISVREAEVIVSHRPTPTLTAFVYCKSNDFVRNH